jgi:predicted transcriptional regulator
MAKVKEEQLSKVVELKQIQEQLTLEVGSLTIAKKEIDGRLEQVYQLAKETAEQVQAIVEEISKEYGPGTLDIQTGEFTPVESPDAEVVE